MTSPANQKIIDALTPGILIKCSNTVRIKLVHNTCVFLEKETLNLEDEENKYWFYSLEENYKFYFEEYYLETGIVEIIE